MDATDSATSHFNSTSTRMAELFFCPQFPSFIWDLTNSSFPWILVVIWFTASPVTVLLYFLAIVALKKRRELQKRSNILLSSMAVTDLVVGAMNMSLSATGDVLILSQASFAHLSTIDLVSKIEFSFLTFCSLYLLTFMSWERYMAIRKWIDYRTKVTRSLLRKLATIAWVLEVCTQVLITLMATSLESKARKTVLELARMRKSLKVQPL